MQKKTKILADTDAVADQDDALLPLGVGWWTWLDDACAWTCHHVYDSFLPLRRLAVVEGNSCSSFKTSPACKSTLQHSQLFMMLLSPVIATTMLSSYQQHQDGSLLWEQHHHTLITLSHANMTGVGAIAAIGAWKGGWQMLNAQLFSSFQFCCTLSLSTLTRNTPWAMFWFHRNPNTYSNKWSKGLYSTPTPLHPHTDSVGTKKGAKRDNHTTRTQMPLLPCTVIVHIPPSSPEHLERLERLQLLGFYLHFKRSHEWYRSQ